MDLHIQKALHDKLYEKRKNGALEYVRCDLPIESMSLPECEGLRSLSATLSTLETMRVSRR